MTKSYLIEFKIHRKMANYSLQKIVLDRFPRNFFLFKNQDRSPRKISR